SPTLVEIALPSALAGDDGAVARAIAGSGYLQRVVGIDPHGLPMSLKPPQLAALTAFADEHPDQPLAALRIGVAHLAAGRVEQALAALRRARDLAPALAPARFALALALLRANEFAAAIVEYRRGLEIAPRDVPARVGLVDALIAAGRGDEAAAEVARV